MIDQENPVNYPESLSWNAYYNLEKIYTWLDEKIAQYPKILTNHIVGKSFLGEDIRAVLLSHKSVIELSYQKLIIQDLIKLLFHR